MNVLYEKVKTDNTKEKASILEDVDFELELLHRDVINVQYILTLLARLYDAEEEEEPKLRKVILPGLGSSSEIPDSFEDFWEQERLSAFEALVKEEDLDAEKLERVIDRYVYTGSKPLPDPDIIELIQRPLKLAERGPAKTRVLKKVVNFVSTYIHGIAA